MKSIIIALVLFSNIVVSQNTKKYDGYKKCYEKDNQTNVNICLGEALRNLESQIDKKYNCMLKYFESELQECLSKKWESAEYYKKQIADFKESQKAWKVLKDKNAQVWSGGGGTETPMLVAQSIIRDCKDRLDWLDVLIEDEGQGQTAILKCE